jgi:hypothetical protein
LRTPIGRSQVLSGMLFRAWPVMSRLAAAWRRTALRRTRLVAVVGSYGKTTTTRAIAQVLARPLGPRIELNDKSFIPLALLGTEPGAPHAVIEVGIDHRGQMTVVAPWCGRACASSPRSEASTTAAWALSKSPVTRRRKWSAGCPRTACSW